MRVKDEKYLKWVREQPCAHCKAPGPNHAHHLIGYGMGGMGTKASDILAMSLCGECHDLVHRDYPEWREVQPLWLAKTLEKAAESGVLEARK